MKIAITGAMGVGKTTLGKDLSEATAIRLLPEVAREMAKNGHLLDTEATPETELKIADYQRRLESGYSSWIADRCMVDVLAYTMVLFPEEEELANEINEKLCDTEYDIILYIPPEFAIEDDGVRSIDEDLQKRIDETIKHILLPGDFNPKTYIIRGTKEERVKQVLKIIDTKYENS